MNLQVNNDELRVLKTALNAHLGALHQEMMDNYILETKEQLRVATELLQRVKSVEKLRKSLGEVT